MRGLTLTQSTGFMPVCPCHMHTVYFSVFTAGVHSEIKDHAGVCTRLCSVTGHHYTVHSPLTCGLADYPLSRTENLQFALGRKPPHK